jgi:hypothetical protein
MAVENLDVPEPRMCFCPRSLSNTPWKNIRKSWFREFTAAIDERWAVFRINLP